MKKIFLLLTLILSTVFLCIGCAESNYENTSNLEVNNSTNTDLEEKEEIKEEIVKELKIGEVISTNEIQLTVKKIEFSYDVLPDDISGFYTHYAAESGSVYIHIDADVKNIQKQNLDCDSIMEVKADYNNGYTYTGFAIPEDSQTGFTYANITSIDPLQTLGVRFLIKCPQEVEETNNPLILKFEINGQKYEYKMR